MQRRASGSYLHKQEAGDDGAAALYPRLLLDSHLVLPLAHWVPLSTCLFPGGQRKQTISIHILLFIAIPLP